MLPPRVTDRRAPLHRVLLLLAVLATALAVVEADLSARVATSQDVLSAAFPLVGAGFVLVGTLAWGRRPANLTGFLLCVTGLTVLLAALAGTGLTGVVVATGVLLGETPIAACLHVVLAFPTGRVPTRLDRRLVVALYVLVLVRQAPAALPGPDLEPLRLACSLLGAAVLVVAATRLRSRVQEAARGSSERRVLAAVYGYGTSLLLFFPFSARVLRPLLGYDAVTLASIQVAGLAVLPVVFAAGVLRGGFARTGELAELAAWLGSRGHDEASLREVLAEVLGDPSVEVAFTRPGSGRLIDAEGQATSIDAAGGDRGSVQVLGADGRAAGVTLTYDRVLFADPAPVEQAARVVAIALERERLRAELLAEQEALRSSRSRAVEIGDVQRRELAQDLHDVLQGRLTLAALHAGRLASTTTDATTRDGVQLLRAELDVLITEFRHVVHGVMPALLLERGLPAAVEDLVDRLPVPTRLEVAGADELPPAVATNAYFIIAEAVTNAVRHAEASRLEVSVVQDGDRLRLSVTDDGVGGVGGGPTPTDPRPAGAGLRGIADRTEALDGDLLVSSPRGGGTRLEVVLPCAS